MSRRLVYLGLVLVLSQLSTGCFWHHWGYYRFHCRPWRPCAPVCEPACPVSVGSSPVVLRGPDCGPCATSNGGFLNGGPPNGGPSFPVMGAPPAGVPIITNPMPIYPGAPGSPSNELPTPKPANSGN